MNRIPVLVLCDDLWHPGEIIRKGLTGIAQDKYAFDFVYDAKDTLTPEMLTRYPLIICCKSNQISCANTHEWFEPGVAEVQPSDLADFVRRGGGYLALHAGLSWYPEDKTGMKEFNGSAFIKHPPRCDVDIRVTGPEHPVAQGIEPFTLRDEHYELAMYCNDADVFLRSSSLTGGDQVAGYTRLMGEGRFCALTPGHILSVFENEMMQRLILNAMAWCLKEA